MAAAYIIFIGVEKFFLDFYVQFNFGPCIGSRNFDGTKILTLTLLICRRRRSSRSVIFNLRFSFVSYLHLRKYRYARDRITIVWFYCSRSKRNRSDLTQSHAIKKKIWLRGTILRQAPDRNDSVTAPATPWVSLFLRHVAKNRRFALRNHVPPFAISPPPSTPSRARKYKEKSNQGSSFNRVREFESLLRFEISHIE